MKDQINVKRATLVFLTTGVLLVSLISFVPSASAQGAAYTVKSGDTLGSIALAHRVTVQSILSANPSITDPSRILVGQQITLPAANLAAGQSIWTGFTAGAAGTSTAPAVPVTGGTSTGPTTYTVVRGDSLGSIAFAHQVTVQSILAANPSITDPSRILVGQQLAIPASNLQPGESIWTGFSSSKAGATPAPSTGSATPAPTATAHITG